MSDVPDVKSSRRSMRDPKGRPSMGVVVAIVVAVVVLALIIFIVIWGTSKTSVKKQCSLDADCATGKVCRNGACENVPSCTAPPSKPTPVTIVYDREIGNATVSWGPISGSANYKVYRKLGDPTVSKSNYDERVVLYGTAHTFTSLEPGTHYFAVTAGNECGDSDESSPVVLAPSCDVIPLTPTAPIITQADDFCSDLVEPLETNDIAHDEASGDNPFNLVRGNGQYGIDDYFGAFPSPTGDFTVSLKCSGQPVSYNVTAISVADYALLTYPTGPMVVGSSLPVTWDPLLGAEEYAVTLVCVTAGGNVIFVGGTTPAPNTSLSVATPVDTNLVFASVIGYRLCDKSSASNAGFHIPPVSV